MATVASVRAGRGAPIDNRAGTQLPGMDPIGGEHRGVHPIAFLCAYSSTAERESSKLVMRVRLPLGAPEIFTSRPGRW